MLARLMRVFKLLLIGLLVFYFATLLVFRWVPIPTSAFIERQNQMAREQPRVYLPARYRWVDWEDMPKTLAVAAIAAEDQQFYNHWGVDLKALKKVILESERRNKRPRGASTITQQVAKNLLLTNDRSMMRKGIEAAVALSIELVWPKQRILEVYLNIAQFGNAVYGVGAAAKHWYKKTPKQMNANQQVYLAALLPTPARSNIHNPSPALQKRVRWINRQVHLLGGATILK